MLIVVILLFAASTISIDVNVKEKSKEPPKEFKPEGCDAVKERFGVDRGDKVIYNDLGYCPDMNFTCCTKETFEKLKTWWQGGDQSPRKKRLDEINQYINRTLFILSHTKGVAGKMLPAYTSCHNKAGMEECDLVASTIRTVYNISSRGSVLDKWINKARKCLNYTDNLQNSIFCAVCNPKFGDNYNAVTKTLKISYEQGIDYLNNCIEYIFSDYSLSAFFNQIALLYNYGEDGKLISGKNPPLIDLDMTLATRIEICSKSPHNPVCQKALVDQFSFLGLTKQDHHQRLETIKLQDYILDNEKSTANKRILESSANDIPFFDDVKIEIGKESDPNDGFTFFRYFLNGVHPDFKKLKTAEMLWSPLLLASNFLGLTLCYLTL